MNDDKTLFINTQPFQIVVLPLVIPQAILTVVYKVGTKEIIPADWVRLGRELPDVFLKKRLWQKTWDIPGRLWWLNSPVPSLNWGQPWINAPKDTFSQRGHWGQLLVMIPSENLVIVRVGLNRGKDARFDTDTFLKLARALRGNR
jgi:CubicO group peptidase (beta-lactamase class C family)